MTNLFLIAHKVRGEPAFDIAEHMTCPTCNGDGRIQEDILNEDSTGDAECHECDSLGHWWIIPTSGHRAYPWWSHELDGLGRYSDIGFWPDPIVDEMPEGLPDHYRTRAEPQRDLVAILGLIHKPLAPIKRRF